MFYQATKDHWDSLCKELQDNNMPGVWAGQMVRRIEEDNPVIAEFLSRLLQRFGKKNWFPHAAHCACVMYRLLELTVGTGKLPRVKPEVGGPMETEMLRDREKFQTVWIERLTIENPRAISILSMYIMEHLVHGGSESEAHWVSWAGIVVYQYLVRQYEADELARLPLV